MAYDPQRANPVEEHRRQSRRMIFLPFIVGVVAVLVLTIGAGLLGRLETAFVSNVMLTIFVLCPVALCLLPIYILLVVMVVGMNRAHDGLMRLLQRLLTLSEIARDRTYSITDRAARASINLNARLAPLDIVYNAFEGKQQEGDHDKPNPER